MARAPAELIVGLAPKVPSLADALAIGNSQRRHNRKHSGIVSEISSGTLEAFQLRLKYGTTTFMAPVPMPVRPQGS